MAFFAYHRVSTQQQKLDRGIDEIERFCKEREIVLSSPIFTDKQTGKNFDRPRYTVLKEDVLRADDTLIISEIDRLGRNKQQIVKELNDFKNKGVRVMILELPTTLMDIDIADPLGKLIFETIQNMVIELYACLAQAEVEKKETRQRQGLEAMKARGDWDRYGRPHACKDEDFKKVYDKVRKGELTNVAAAKELGISLPTFYRYREKYDLKKVV